MESLADGEFQGLRQRIRQGRRRHEEKSFLLYKLSVAARRPRMENA